MKKRYKLAAILSFTIVGLLFVWILARVTGALQFYKVPTPSNESTIHQGSLFFSSNLVHPRRMDFISHVVDQSKAYPDENLPKGSMSVWLHRLCGLPGDTVALVNGVLFVDGKNMDEALHLSHIYLVPTDKSGKIVQKYHIPEEEVYDEGNGWVLLTLDQTAAQSEELNRYILPRDQPDSTITAVFHHPWNRDQFGPIVVPPGTYFILGDNRENSLDSRYMGFILQSSWKGTVLGY